MENIKEQVREYIKGAVFTDQDKINDDTLIFQEGYFDSMGFVSLLGYIEETFGIESTDEDLVEENFESIDAISQFVEKRKAKAA